MTKDNDALAAPSADEAPEGEAILNEAAAVADAFDELVPSIFDLYETDTNAEENGKWFNNLRPGVSLKLRRTTSRYAMDARRRVLARFRKLATNGEFSEKVQAQILVHVMAEGIIVDWKGEAFRNKDGSPLPYSKQNAVALLSKVKALRDELTAVASDMDNYRIEQREAVAGN